MRNHLWAIAAQALACLLVSSAPPDDKAARVIKGWGEVVDPDGDCKFQSQGSSLTIIVPGTLHDLSTEFDEVNAPRVLREVEGDFIVQVKVGGKVKHQGKRTSSHYLAYHGAGMLIWLDDKTNIRLERAMIFNEGEATHYAMFQLMRNAKIASSDGLDIPDEATFLRIERRGQKVYGSVSQDGHSWGSFNPIGIDLRRKLTLGVAAVNTSTEPFKAELDEFALFRKVELEANP